ncbi:DUF6479 family protein [Streptomyces sp. NBC_00539]|uniref:DUF6479 family protein n=1 Tax=Streptomyces sp. NBC_00539 TaxID=2975770 RepID=UPI002E8028F8|nr:DUF6479 family protein [Streptomyces sp. NBC_00539]WUC63295.1 DUF6479 family protein [Streptomyces sp. NBC_00539]
MMNSATALAMSASGTAFASTVGVIVVVVLIGAVWWGMKRRAAEPKPPTAAEQPRRPADAGRSEERREAQAQTFPTDGSRRTAHDLQGYGNFGSPEDERS